MKKLWIFAVVLVLGVAAATIVGRSNPHPGVPKPIKILENPQTGQQVRFYKEIWYKVPGGYDEKKHIVQWIKDRQAEGFTKEVPLK
jgi:hypothetical protein